LRKESKVKIAALIDEYDAPVTGNLANLEVGQANADILNNFFATLKNVDALPCVEFTMVTGITRYALTSMDSGANHLLDISLDPDYASCSVLPWKSLIFFSSTGWRQAYLFSKILAK
jgi:hypothetical protein